MSVPINWRVVEAETMAIRWIAEYREGKCSSPAVESELRRFSLDAAKAAIELRVPTPESTPNHNPKD